MAKKQAVLVLELIFFLLITLASCSFGQLQNLSSDKVSDGVQHGESACKPAYGFLPCTRSVIGNIFLIFVYGYLIFMAAKWLTKGSEVLLEINGYGVFGGLFLPILCSLPGALIILASGLFGSKETAQSQASIGMGLLAGSSITLLTLLWGSCVFAGKCDLQNSIASNQNASSLTGSGIVTDPKTSYPVWIMLMSIVPFILLMLLQIFLTSRSHLAILISLLVSVSLLLSYCLYQIFEHWIQYRRLAYAMYKRAKCVMIWLTETGEPDREGILKLFKRIDHNSDGYLSAQELRALVFGLNLEEIDSDIGENLQKLLNHFDTSGDARVDENEFVEGMSKWVKEDLHCEPDHQESQAAKLKRIFRKVFFIQGISESSHHDQDHPAPRLKHSPLPKRKLNNLLIDEELESSEESTRDGTIAILKLLLGAAIAAAFAHPFANTMHNLSTATTIPPFFISFVILPFVCSSEIVPALVLASRKKQKLASLIFSEIYREVTMSNILYLSSILLIVYVRDLTWNFWSEIIVVVVVCIVMGIFAGWRTTFHLSPLDMFGGIFVVSVVSSTRICSWRVVGSTLGRNIVHLN